MPPQGQSPETNEKFSVWHPSLTRTCFDQDECSAELGSCVHTRPAIVTFPEDQGGPQERASAHTQAVRTACLRVRTAHLKAPVFKVPWNSVGGPQAMEFSLGSGVWTSSPALEQSPFLSPGPAVAHWLTHCPGQWSPRRGLSSILRPPLHRLLSAVVSCVLLCCPLTQY